MTTIKRYSNLKKNYMRKLTLLLTILAYLLLSCSKENTDQDPMVKQYGQKDSVAVTMCYTIEGMSTKAVNEALVENVNLYIINELGDLITHGYYTSPNNIETVIYKDMRYTVYAIANAGMPLPAKSAQEVDNLVYSISSVSQMASGTGAVLMSGKSGLQTLANNQSLPITLTRCISKIVVRADYNQLNPDVTINVKSVQLKNIPKNINIFKDSKITSVTGAIDGEKVTNPTAGQLTSGVVLYQYENKQGTLLPGNLIQTEKTFEAGNIYASTCSYVEINATYSSPKKRGDIVYRFFLGKDMTSNFDVVRNTQHNITVSFTGDGAVSEATWRVDNSEIVDLVTSISLSPTSHKFTELGATKQITATVLPLTAANKSLNWSSSNNAVATVNANGVVKAIGDGSCTITATSTDGTNISASVSITVDSKIYVTGVTMNPTTLSMYVDETAQLSASVQPSNATVKTLNWSSSNNAVATVDANGKVTAKGTGTCTITATSTDDTSKKATCSVTVLSKEFSISPTAKTLYPGESFTISYTIKPPLTPTFSSENTAVATVDANGKVTAVGAGETRIKVSGHWDLFCEVTVVAGQIEFMQKSIALYDGETAHLQFSKLVPAGANYTVTSSNGATVQILSYDASGVVVKGLTAGSATITATLGPVSTTCSVTVEKLRIVPTETNITLYNNFYHDIGYTIYPARAASLGVTVTPNITGVKTNYDGVANRVIPTGGPATETITISIAGRSDVSATISATVKPQLTMLESVNVHTNMGGSATVVDLKVETSPRAQISWSWDKNPTEMTVSNTGILTVPLGAVDNGEYKLTATVTGDNDKTATATCTITLYETLYLVGVSKSETRESQGHDNGTGEYYFKYVNEVVAKLLSHPDSKKWQGEEVTGMEVSFTYNGQYYENSHTSFYEELNGTFVKGETYQYIDGSQFTFNGNNAPQTYLEYFNLETSEKTRTDSSGRLYWIYSRTFASGWGKPSMTWKQIFDIIY